MILVHHLRIGRSVFTVWLIEELGLDYELKIYERNPETMRAGPELKAAHPLGKSPVVEVDGMVLSESGAIAAYLVDRYDTEGRLSPGREDPVAWGRYLQWLHYPEGSAFLPFFLNLLLAREAEPKPKVFAGFAAAETKLHLDYIAASLGDQPYILGDTFQAPDIGVGYAVNMAGRLGLLGAYPTLADYAKRMTDRPSFGRAAQRTGG